MKMFLPALMLTLTTGAGLVSPAAPGAIGGGVVARPGR